MEVELIEKIVEKYANMVYRIALTRTGTIENAEDVFQEVFLKYSEKKPQFYNEEHEKAWFIRVTLNLSKNLKNSAWNKRTITLAENYYFSNDKENEIFLAVCELPENYKTVIYLLYYEKYKVKEIAEILHKKEGTIKTWLSRGRQLLKNKIEGGFENE